MSNEKTKFESWWKETGQFDCASGGDSHKQTIQDAFLAGWQMAMLEIQKQIRKED